MMMDKSHWKKLATAAGWQIEDCAAGVLHLVCAKQGCKERKQVHLASAVTRLDPCEAPHVQQYSAAAYGAYADLVDQLKRRRRMLGLSQEDISAAAGLADGHISKLEALHRHAQFDTLQLWAQTLGFALTLAPTTLPPELNTIVENGTGTRAE